jgi:NitT/TauT family transport system substrate-binding protein
VGHRLLVATASLALGVAPLSQPLAPDAPFTVAVNTTTIEGSPVYVAIEASNSRAFRLINGGVRDLANAGAHAATNAETQMLLASTTNPKIRMLLTVAEGHYRVIARRSAGINRIEDLRGKRITTVRNTSAHYYLVKLLASAGLRESDVAFVDVERTDMAAAVMRREADAISMWEPEAQATQDALGSDAIVFQNSRLYRELFSLYTTTDVLNDARRRRELVEFVRAVLAATDRVRRSPDTMIPIVARTIKQSDSKVRSAWAHHTFPGALPPEMLDILVEEERWIAQGQRREPRTREVLGSFIDTSILKEARDGR